jgi:hypothetical protein
MCGRITRGHGIYAQRKITVDPVVGRIKGRGGRRVSRRGADRVTGEFQVVCALPHPRHTVADGQRGRAALECRA